MSSVRTIETRDAVRKLESQAQSKAASDRQKKTTAIVRKLREIQASGADQKDRIDMLISEIIKIALL